MLVSLVETCCCCAAGEEVGQLQEVDQGTQVHVVEAGVGSPHHLS